MNDHAFYDGDVKAKLDDPKSYSPDGISGSGDEVSFALADHYFAPLLRTLDVNSIGDAYHGRVENSATLSADDTATGITVKLEGGTDSGQASLDGDATVNGATLSLPDVNGESLHEGGTVGAGVIEAVGLQESPIDTASIYGANEEDGNPGDLTIFADATNGEFRHAYR